jgi:polyisoprenoid-binding protein YceI
LFIIAAILIARDWVIPTFSTVAVTGVPTQADSFASLKTSQAQTKAAVTATPAAMNIGADGILLMSYKGKALQQQQPTYESCTVLRGSTPTPTGNTVQPTTAAATPEPVATEAAAAPGPEDFVFLKIDGAQSEACYQVGELFLDQDSEFNLAIGVTHSIDGEVAVDRNNIANSKISDIVINVAEFKSDQPRRDGIIRERWLQSNKYPYAKLTKAQTIGLPARPYKDGETVNFQIIGDLEVHGNIRPTTFTATATLKGNTLLIQAHTDVKMTDFGFDPPDIAGVVKANNDARLVLNLIATAQGADTTPTK